MCQAIGYVRPPVTQPVVNVAAMGVPMPLPVVLTVFWHLSVGGQTYGSYTMQALQQMIPAGQFTI